MYTCRQQQAAQECLQDRTNGDMTAFANLCEGDPEVRAELLAEVDDHEEHNIK